MKTMLKTVALATTLALGGTAAVAQTVPAATIIIVDMDQVINGSVAGKAAAAELKSKMDAIQARLASLRTQFGTETQTLAKARPAQTAAPAAITAWETKARDLQSRQQTAETDLATRDRDFQASRQYTIKQLNDGANPIISAIMRERGASIAMPEGATLQHSGSIDVTTDVIARLDKALPRVSTAAPAQPK